MQMKCELKPGAFQSWSGDGSSMEECFDRMDRQARRQVARAMRREVERRRERQLLQRELHAAYDD